MKVKLSEIGKHLGIEVSEKGEDISITGVAPIEVAGKNELTFLSGEKYIKLLEKTDASAVLLKEGFNPPENTFPLYVDDPYFYFIKLLNFFNPRSPEDIASGISPLAVVDDSAIIGKNVSLAPNVVIGEGVNIGDNTVIGAGTVVMKNSEIGSGCIIYPNVSIIDRTTIGNNTIIHAGVVIGSDGFGFYPHGKSLVKVPQIGRVEIGDNVEIQANCCIDRAVMGVTKIESGVKLDNLVHVGHNVRIGANTVLAGQVGIAGSTQIGKGVKAGGQAGITEHISVGDGVGIAGQAGVTKDVPPGIVVSGYPAKEHRKAILEEIHIRNLPNLKTKIKELEKRILEFEKK